MRSSSFQQQGFTLVELAIVLMIIGLLIGGVLRGQELLNNARVTATVQQIKSYQGAFATFQDAYNALPGDMRNAAAKIPNCSNAPCNIPGDGNGIIGQTTSAGGGVIQTGDTSENRIAWLHLSKAHLITGIKADVPYQGVFGIEAPTAPAGGGFQWFYKIIYPAAGPADWFAGAKSGTWLSWTNGKTDFLDFSGSVPMEDLINVTPAMLLDKKMDDGLPHTGDVAAGSTSGGCNNFGANAYDVQDERAACSMVIYMQ